MVADYAAKYGVLTTTDGQDVSGKQFRYLNAIPLMAGFAFHVPLGGGSRFWFTARLARHAGALSPPSKAPAPDAEVLLLRDHAALAAAVAASRPATAAARVGHTDLHLSMSGGLLLGAPRVAGPRGEQEQGQATGI